MCKKIGTVICNEINSVNNPIVVFLPKSANSVISFLGILYSGNFYVPLDYDSANERLKLIINKLSPAYIITTRQDQERFEALNDNKVPVFYIEELFEKEIVINNNALEERLDKIIDKDPIYLIYTSGSTGDPKGVLICHQSVIDYIDWAEKCFNINDTIRIGNQAPFYFDNSVLDIYLCLFTGATLVIIPENLFIYISGLVSFLNENKINFIFWVPSALINIAKKKLLDSTGLKYLKFILFAGEVMPNVYLNYWRTHIKDALYANLYGPTEITVDCTYYIVDRDFKDEDPLPIGIPCRNSEILIFNKKNKLVKMGEVGELCVRGASLSLGYYNDPQKTNESFIQNPLNSKYPDIVYKTGDFVKVNERGEIIYIGRSDNQIKYNGYRIELGDIENSLLQVDGLKNSFVFFDKEANKIVAFCETQNGFLEMNIRNILLIYIPKHMIPHKFYFLEVLPTNPNGKRDRKKMMEMYYSDAG